MIPSSLPKSTYSQITCLCREGDELFALQDFEKSLEKYRQAWSLVPDPKIDWEASTWILASAGEVYFAQGNYEKSLSSFARAVQGPGGLGNPYIHLRLGQSSFELGDLQRAGDELTRAFMSEGEHIFIKEKPKYLDFLKTLLRPTEKQSDD